MDETDPVPDPPRRKKRKCTYEEAEARVNFAATLLSQLVPEWEVKKALKQKYELKYRQCAEYITRARATANKWATAERKEILELVRSLLQGMLRGNLKPWERLRVIERIAALYGLNEADKLELTGKDGGPLQHQDVKGMTDEQLAAMALGALGKPVAPSTAEPGNTHGPTNLPAIDGHPTASGESTGPDVDGTPPALGGPDAAAPDADGR